MTPVAPARLAAWAGSLARTRSRGEARVGEPAHRALTYRPELDALRAIAVALVLGFHLGVPVFADHGRTGVTIFFVLSGFLITSLLFAEQTQTGRIAVRAFYVRRIRRLVPALFVVLAAVTAIALARGRMDVMALPIFSAVTYTTDIAKAVFAPALGPFFMGELDHTWTLGVEEQFYLAWPLILVAVGLSRVAARPWLLVIPAIAFNLLEWTGFDAITAGCLLGLLAATGRMPVLPLAVVPLAVAGLALSVIGAPVGVPAAFLLVAYLARHESQALAHPTLVTIGKLSYGIYLWQYPVLWELGPLVPGLLWAPVVVAVTVGLAYLSRRFVELRFQQRSSTPRSRGLALAYGTTSR